MALTLHGKEVTNVFRLSGNNENSASFALGWALEQSSNYRHQVSKEIFGEDIGKSGMKIAMQKHGEDGGYTDIEIVSGREFHAILEAKRSWGLPSANQLGRYLPRLARNGAKRQRLVSVGAASQMYAQQRLPKELSGVIICHLSWGDLQRLAKKAAMAATAVHEKIWLRQLIQHLKEFASMGRQNDNRVFVAALKPKPMKGRKGPTFVDAVEKDNCYFHPVGGSYPKEPPNYVGFRYRGRLQSVHHIESVEVIKDLSTRNASWPKTTKNHFVYRLGPAMRPMHEIRTGNLFRAQHVDCAIDTLLSGAFDTIRDAYDETKRRLDDLD